MLRYLKNSPQSWQDSKVGQTKGICFPGAGEDRLERYVPVTAEIAKGRRGVVNIERRTRDGRLLLDKGNIIINNFLKSNFAQGDEISISARIFFEMPCRLVPADCASSAELLALLSRIANLPVRQDIAVTGILNQEGDLEAGDSLGDRIELLFDSSRTEELHGLQGVMIPQAAVPDMVLRRDVIQAVENHFFHLIPVRTIEEGIQILTGVEVGEKDTFGNHPAGTVNYLVHRGLQRHAV
jgi:predicted ATP-dependent protease